MGPVLAAARRVFAEETPGVALAQNGEAVEVCSPLAFGGSQHRAKPRTQFDVFADAEKRRTIDKHRAR
jgi:hypothetical protein